MSFSEDCVRFGDRFAKLVDAGVTVRQAAGSLGISRQRGYAILRAIGRPMGVTRPAVGGVDPAVVVSVFSKTGSINRAAKAAGVSHGRARRVLVARGLVCQEHRPVGKPGARERFQELLAQGWSATRAAREVGVNERTARDWRDGVRKVGNTRVHPDGTVIDYTTGARYTCLLYTSPSPRD